MKRLLSILSVVFLLVSFMAFSTSAAPVTATGKNLSLQEGDSYDLNNWRSVSKNEGGMKIENGKIIATNAQDKDLIGPQGIYEEFTISFDMITKPGTWFGLTFGNENPDDFFAVPDQVLFMVGVDRFFAMIPVKTGGGEDYFVPSQGSNWFPAETNMLELGLEGEFTSFILSFDKDKNLKVSYRLPGEAESVLAAPRAVFSNVPEAAGYLNFVSTGVGATGSNYEVKNIKLFNTANADVSAAIPASKAALVTEALLTQKATSKDVASNSVKIDVEEIAGATGYGVNVFTKDGTLVKTEIFADKNAIDITGLLAETDYKLQVVALGASNAIIGHIAALDVKTLAASTTTETTATTTTKGGNANTGESSNSFVFIAIALSAIAIILVIVSKKRTSLNK